jgi:tetratricopeptide (TPR) repeat protein
MVDKSWADASVEGHHHLMVELARANMQQYWDKVTDAQSKASLLHMLGDSLILTLGEEATLEGEKYKIEAMELILSMGERSASDIVFGVWPEACLRGWWCFLQQLDPSERNGKLEPMLEVINLTRRTIDSELERAVGNANVSMLRFLSERHYCTELEAIFFLSSCVHLLSKEDSEAWLAVFDKRIEEVEIIYEREGWDLGGVRETKAMQMGSKCRLYQRQGKVKLAVEFLSEALKEEEDDLALHSLCIELSLKTGRLEEACKSMEKVFLAYRSKGEKTMVGGVFKRFWKENLPKKPEFQMAMTSLIPNFPHVLWAASLAGLARLSEAQSKNLRKQLEAKKILHCVNCNKKLTKVYRCSRCNLATYCGSTCQKEAWKEHKKICKPKKKEEEEDELTILDFVKFKNTGNAIVFDYLFYK